MTAPIGSRHTCGASIHAIYKTNFHTTSRTHNHHLRELVRLTQARVGEPEQTGVNAEARNLKGRAALEPAMPLWCLIHSNDKGNSRIWLEEYGASAIGARPYAAMAGFQLEGGETAQAFEIVSTAARKLPKGMIGRVLQGAEVERLDEDRRQDHQAVGHQLRAARAPPRRHHRRRRAAPARRAEDTREGDQRPDRASPAGPRRSLMIGAALDAPLPVARCEHAPHHQHNDGPDHGSDQPGPFVGSVPPERLA